jgi:hypothetical protein
MDPAPQCLSPAAVVILRDRSSYQSPAPRAVADMGEGGAHDLRRGSSEPGVGSNAAHRARASDLRIRIQIQSTRYICDTGQTRNKQNMIARLQVTMSAAASPPGTRF